MSQRPAEIPAAQPAVPRTSAVGIIIRRGPDGGWQVVLGRRSRRSRFMPGAWAFIGGAIEPIDEPTRGGAKERCVSREVAEETGLIVPPEKWRSAGRRVTPPIYPVRYDTFFFLTEVSEGTELPGKSPVPDELEELRWVGAGRALVEWETSESDIPPVLPPILRLLADTRRRSVARLASKLAEIHELEEKVPRIEFVPGIWMLAMRSETLPPATHTNAWLVGGKKFLVVDPGGDDAPDIEQLVAVVERRREEGHVPQAILLTHDHVDHTAGAAVLAAKLSLPVRAHEATLAALGLPKKVKSAPVADEEKFELDGMTAIALHTPGHAAGHLALFIPEREVAIVGDLVSGQSTVLVDPEEGDMGAYMRSLRRVGDLRSRLLLPAHGIPQPAAAIDNVIEHRWGREAGLLAALGSEPRPLGEIVDQAYVDRREAPAFLKERQALAHLVHLERKGVVRRDGDAWALAGES